jgi:hypothetical protein
LHARPKQVFVANTGREDGIESVPNPKGGGRIESEASLDANSMK